VSEERTRRWGWHQLTGRWAERVVAEAGIRPGELVLDVGAGTGALTGPLVAAGARVIAIELHTDRLDHLRERFADDDVKVVKADAGSLRLPRRPFRVVANPPFAVTSPLLRRLLAPGSRLVAADLVLPRPVVQRWSSGRAPGVGRWHLSHHVGPGPRLPRSAFVPAAPVDCQTLVIRRRQSGGPRSRS
jgi:23S rRNA (adenine-N6)-dimethyltransferase